MKRSSGVSLLLSVALMCAALATGAHAQAPTAAKAPSPTVPEQVAEAFRYGDLAELERLYAVHGQPGARSPATGTERIQLFWSGIGRVSAANLSVSEGYYLQMDALTQAWALDHPQSVLAQLLHANSLRTHAWFFRGDGYANAVSPASWAAFGKYLNLALDQLRRSEALAAKDSSWNHLMLEVGRGLGWNVNQLLPLLENGIARNPDHDDLYFRMQLAMVPKWGGDVPMVERFIESVTRNTRERRGMEMYARLYASLSYTDLKQSLFSAARVSWPQMKAGFEDRLSRFPHTDHRNMYAYFACMAKDRQALQEQLALMGDAFESIFWGDSPARTFDECKTLAQQS